MVVFLLMELDMAETSFRPQKGKGNNKKELTDKNQMESRSYGWSEIYFQKNIKSHPTRGSVG